MENSLSDREMAENFRSLATDVRSPAQADALLDRLWRLERVEDSGRWPI